MLWAWEIFWRLYTFGKMTWSNLIPFFLRKIPTRKPQESQNCWILFCVLENGTLGSLGRGKKTWWWYTFDDPSKADTQSDMFRGRNLFKMVDQYKVPCFFHEISRSTCVIFPLVHQTCCNTSLRVGSTGSVVRPILWTNGMMLGSWVFRWHTEKTRWFSEGFRTNYRNLNRPHVKMCFSKGNLPKHGLNLGWSWKTISNSFFRIFFWVLCIDFTNIHLQ